MAKKTGLLALVTGLAAGAAAVFLAKPENRAKVKKVAQEIEQDPQAAVKKLKTKSKKLVKSAQSSLKTKTAAPRKKIAKTVKIAKASKSKKPKARTAAKKTTK